MSPAGATPRSAARRVAEVHAQARRGVAVAVAFVLVAVVSAVARGDSSWWLPLHLFAVGGLLSVISAVTQMLAVTWSAAPAPRPAVAAGQRWLLAAGAVGLVIGRDAGRTWLVVAGGAAVVLAMVALAGILLVIRRTAVIDRFTPALDAQVAAIVAGAAGMTLGVVLGAGGGGSSVARLRGAHLVLNVFGLVGLVIAGTLPFFSATVVRAKMSTRATPVRLRVTVLVLAVATVVAACGQLVGRSAVTATGLCAYAAGLLVVAVMLPLGGWARLRWAGPRALQLLSGLGWWAAMTVVLAVVTVSSADDGPVLRALVVGGFAQIVVASLAYLGPVLRGGGHRMLTAGFATTRSWISLIAGNAAAVAALADHPAASGVALSVWIADVVLRVAVLVRGRVRSDRSGAP